VKFFGTFEEGLKWIKGDKKIEKKDRQYTD
jgi:hypothetical protein